MLKSVEPTIWSQFEINIKIGAHIEAIQMFINRRVVP